MKQVKHLILIPLMVMAAFAFIALSGCASTNAKHPKWDRFVEWAKIEPILCCHYPYGTEPENAFAYGCH